MSGNNDLTDKKGDRHNLGLEDCHPDVVRSLKGKVINIFHFII